eukprot:TRINITY_DN26832_c0_g1_i1.p1 TRINITY_DN26832_c0_g1~~TRINITY_DN26832_c0_g1_i1.p1  ORF type:complete len:227 (+),score=2.97 TRINITY_DN26832_c0_g1_i1:2-682(+)
MVPIFIFFCYLVNAQTRLFHHSLIFDATALAVAPIITSKPQYRGINTAYSFHTICIPVDILYDTNRLAGELTQAVIATDDPLNGCTSACCGTAGCVGWVYLPSAPSTYGNCEVGDHCCYLKSTLNPPSVSTFPNTVAAGMASVLAPVPSDPSDLWTCFNGRATSLGGGEIGHVEMCVSGALAMPFSNSFWVAKLVVEDVGTLVVAFHMEGCSIKYRTRLPGISILP